MFNPYWHLANVPSFYGNAAHNKIKVYVFHNSVNKASNIILCVTYSMEQNPS